MESYSRDLQNSLLQAREVKCDLEEMMLNTINLSRDLVDGLEGKVNRPILNPSENTQEVQSTGQKDMKGKIGRTGSRPASAACECKVKIRVYELAEELGINTREFMMMCKDAGFDINHHMNVMNEEQISYFRQNQQMPQIDIDVTVSVPEPVSAGITDEPVTKIEENPFTSIKRTKESEFTLEEIKQAHPYIAVRMLSEQGYNQKEIAQILDRGQGEVSLILNLAKRKQAI